VPRLTIEILPPHPRAGKVVFYSFPLAIGRNPKSELAFDPEADRATSWDHAQLSHSENGFVLTDRGSTNGTFVNGKRITTGVISDGDRIELGSGGPQIRVHIESPTPIGDQTAKTMIVTSDLPTIHLKLVAGGRGKPPVDRDFHQQVITLGRDPQNDISFADPPHPVVSRFHAEIVLRGGEYYLVDKKATNGTLLNDRPVEQNRLQDGDRITLGEDGPVFAVGLGDQHAEAATGTSLRRVLPWLGVALVLVLAAVWFWPSSESDSEVVPAESLSESRFIEQSVILFAHTMGEEINSVPSSMVRSIQRYTAVLARQQRRAFLEKLRRAQDLMPQVQRILRENGLPTQFAYIAFQESRFDPRARSGVGAVGLWQLMPRTARELGLQVDDATDERLDPIKSTYAAARYLKQLYARYGDGMLALAAYNHGLGNINRVLTRIEDPLRNRNYWYLVKKDLLPKETDEYVYKIISGWIVATNPERFGFPAELATEEPA
jgi:pSer/pThr/pTyr-binding forkhead associated (FHA) protein